MLYDPRTLSILVVMGFCLFLLHAWVTTFLDYAKKNPKVWSRIRWAAFWVSWAVVLVVLKLTMWRTRG